MSETDEEILKELRIQSRLIELMENRQSKMYRYLKLTGTLVVIALFILVLAHA